ncbi:FNBP1 [Lepeophtheirus salmonis]|uniref:FNBP1 n=1 Tax=Lepeophtheirus salmonis TaxID=72036 RepID=A0A0K2V4Z3_LEPSM|nr:cdc42-interacting protein 4-like [Lepeophtheirus salmonis]CAB4069447.1 FNBP1 [Lepeophtheirus salmonis]CAF3027495.1 FNBP1 [Lepeophtheirus salmonis]
MSWGTELWDRYKVLYRHSEGGIDFLENSVSNFINERGKIEKEYAHKLRKLVDKFHPKESGGNGKKFTRPNEEYSYITGYKEMLQEVGYIAGQHEIIAEHCSIDNCKKMKEQIKKLKEKRKKNLKEFNRIESDLKRTYSSFESCRNEFRKAYEDSEKSTEAYRQGDLDGNVSPKEMEKLKNMMNSRSQNCDVHKGHYASSLLETNDFQREYYSRLLPEVLDTLQGLEKDQIAILVEAISSYIHKEKDILPIIGKCHESIIKALEKVSPQDDTEIDIEKFKSGDIPPGDFKMDDMSNPYEMLTKDPVEKATNLNLYPRKRELEHILDEKEKELATVNKTLSSINLMITSYEKNPSFGSKKDKDKFNVEKTKLLSQKNTLEVEVSNLHAELTSVEDRLELLKNRSPISSSNSPMFLQRDHRGSQSSGSLKSSNLSIGSNSINTNTTNGNMNTSPDHSVPEEEYESWNDNNNNRNNGGGLSPLPPPPPPPPMILDSSTAEVLICSAMYAYDGDDVTENIIPMADGERFQILEEDFDHSGWTRVKRLSLKFFNDSGEGYVPTSFLKICYPAPNESRI